MPDLSDLEFPLKKYTLLDGIIGNPGITEKESQYRINFIRLVDKSFKEYMEAREILTTVIKEFNSQIEERNTGSLIGGILSFTDHFENCVNALVRLMNQLEVIKRDAQSWDIDRIERKKINAHLKELPNIRHKIEHLEEDIRNEETLGKPIMLAFGDKDDRVVIGDYEIKFESIALSIKALHRIGKDLFAVN